METPLRLAAAVVRQGPECAPWVLTVIAVRVGVVVALALVTLEEQDGRRRRGLTRKAPWKTKRPTMRSTIWTRSAEEGTVTDRGCGYDSD